MGEYIKREAALAEQKLYNTYASAEMAVPVDALRSIPAADVVERKKGKWIKMSDVDGIYWACSECGEDIPRIAHFNPQFDLFPKMESINRTNYCPSCGVKMDGGQDA